MQDSTHEPFSFPHDGAAESSAADPLTSILRRGAIDLLTGTKRGRN